MGGIRDPDDLGYFVFVKFTEARRWLEEIQDFRELRQIGFIFSSHDLTLPSLKKLSNSNIFLLNFDEIKSPQKITWGRRVRCDFCHEF